MKSLILVAVILQLVIIGTETVNEHNFGDIIELPRFCYKDKAVYSHYVMYVGKGPNGVWKDVGQGDNDIFHLTGIGSGKPGMSTCTFGKLAETKGESDVIVNNYLDSHIPSEDRSPDKISQRIIGRKGECGIYRPFKKNCEHTVTEMRYGVPKSEQAGTTVQCVFSTVNAVNKLIKSTVERSAENHDIGCPFSK